MVLEDIAERLERAGLSVTRFSKPCPRLVVGVRGRTVVGDVTTGAYCGERWVFLGCQEIAPVRDLDAAVATLLESLESALSRAPRVPRASR